jgi:hypothetical protein
MSKVTLESGRFLKDNFSNLNNWYVTKHANDVVEFGGDTYGSGYQKISKCPFTPNTETKLVSKFTVSGVMRLGLALSMSQRIAGQKFTYELASVDDNGNIETSVPVATAIACTTIAQAGSTTLTVTTATAHGVKPGDRIVVYGSPDSRLNYGDLVVETITSPTVFTTTAEQIGALPSITASTAGFIVKIDPLSRQTNSFAALLEGASATSGRLVHRVDGEAFLQSAQATFTTSAANLIVSSGYCDSIQPAALWEFKLRPDSIVTRTFLVDSLSTIGGTLRRTQSIPSVNKQYKIVIRATTNIEGMSRPVCKIISATKAGSTTATIVTDVPHGLTTGDYINIIGIRDQTNFANLTTATAVASVTNSTTFTIAFGGSYTGVSYGGTIVKIVGAHTSAVPNISVQSISRTNNLLTLVGNTTWTGVSVGDSINVYGLYDTAGTYLPYDGYYKVAAVSTTNLVLYSTGANVGSTNCGGAIIRRTDFRLHFLRYMGYQNVNQLVDLDSGTGDSNDVHDSIPVAITASTAISVTATGVAGAAAHDAAVSGSPVRLAGRARTSNYTTVSSDDTADLITTLAGAVVNKPFSIPEVDFYAAAPLAGLVNTTTPLIIKEAAAAGTRNYYTGVELYAEALTNATELELRDTDLTCASQTISANTLTTSAVHNLSIGDQVVFTAITGATGFVVNTTYYVLTVPSTTTLTLSATRGGSTLSISGTITATLHRVLWRTKIPTGGRPETAITFPSPIKGSVATAQSIQTLTASGAGAVYANFTGYVAP